MKQILSIIIITYAAYSHAIDFDCTKQISDTRSERAIISSFPETLVSLSFSDCHSSGGVGGCTQGTMASPANRHGICFQNINVKNDCTVNESTGASTSSITVTCNNGYTLTFVVNAASAGQLACLQNGVTRKTWDVGTCVAK